MQVVVDRSKLAAYKLAILNVRDAIDRFNVSRPAGTITNGPREAIARVDTRARSAEDVLGYPIAEVSGGTRGNMASQSAPMGSDGIENRRSKIENRSPASSMSEMWRAWWTRSSSGAADSTTSSTIRARSPRPFRL